MTIMWVKIKGFTIVELLIVIVVIGILASITVVAYSGMQQRGKVTKKQAEISVIKEKLDLYHAFNTSGFSSTTGTISSLELGALASEVILASDIYNLTPCQASPMTKAKYCFVAYKDTISPYTQHHYIIWWNDTKNKWVVSSSVSSSENFSGNPSAPGTGAYPQSDMEN